MANGSPPVRTIRSASDEAAAKTGSFKAHTIHSASDEGATGDGRHVAKHSHHSAARSSTGTAAQASRDFVKQATDWSAQRVSAGGARDGALDGHAGQGLTPTPEFGTLMSASYGAACSELGKQMHQAALRQSGMLNDMLRARSPSDVLLAGNRFWLGSLQAFFDASARIAQASVHAAGETGRNRIRRAG